MLLFTLNLGFARSYKVAPWAVQTTSEAEIAPFEALSVSTGIDPYAVISVSMNVDPYACESV